MSSTKQSQTFANASTFFHLGPEEAHGPEERAHVSPGADSLSPPSELL